VRTNQPTQPHPIDQNAVCHRIPRKSRPFQPGHFPCNV
jgi:hypothetical protein